MENIPIAKKIRYKNITLTFITLTVVYLNNIDYDDTVNIYIYLFYIYICYVEYFSMFYFVKCLILYVILIIPK